MSTCSVVVCTQNRPKQLERCLRAIRTSCYPQIEIIVVDNGTEHSETRQVASTWDAKYVVEPVKGLSRSRNSGVRHSKAEIVTFIDDDALPKENWLCEIMREFEDPNVMAVAGLIHPMTPNPYEGVELYVRRRQKRKVFDLSVKDWFALTNFGGIGDGSNMAFRREKLELLGGFNERLGLGTSVRGSEEHYAFFELVKRGHRIAFTPTAVVQHPFPESLQDARKRAARCGEGSFAYMAFLFFEEPNYRGPLVRFLARAILRRLTRRRRSPIRSRRHEVSWLFKGLRHYLRSRAANNSSLPAHLSSQHKQVFPANSEDR
jgi:cellulose synthase/poly-beta-1,6-N-acetylglucosamine synthase-like glycosyltransferase